MKAMSGKKYTARELAAQFGCDERTVQRHGNKLFGQAQNGVAREFDEAQVTAILESVKAAHEGGERAKNTSTTSCRGALNESLANTETELTKQFRLAMIYKRDAELMKEAAGLEHELRVEAETALSEARHELGAERKNSVAIAGKNATLTIENTDLHDWLRIRNEQLITSGLAVSDREYILAIYRL
jgi:hypothetical protein